MKEQNIQQQNLSESYDNLGVSLLDNEIKSIRGNSNCVSKLFLWWITPTLMKAQKQSLEINNLDELGEKERSTLLHEKFKTIFYSQPQVKYSLTKALIKTFFMDLFIIFIWLALAITAQIVAPIIVKMIIEYLNQDKEDNQYAIILISSILFSRFINTIAQSQVRFLIRILGLDAQSVISIELLAKSFRTSFLSNVNHSSGEVINLMQVDAGRLQFVTFYLGVAILCPIQVAITIYLMFRFIGIAFLSGFGVMILSGIVNSLIGKILQKYQAEWLKQKDVRTKCANQLFSQIKFIKINALEEYFKEKIFKLRTQETNTLKKRFLCSVFIIFSVWLTPLMILTATFATFLIQGENLTAANTFAIIGLFQMLQQPLLQLPMAINELIATNVSLQRIEKFFFTKELMMDCIEQDYYHEEQAISMENANFYWPITKKEDSESKQDQKSNKKKQKKQVNPEIEEPKTQLVLKDLSLSIEQGQFVAIIGDVGSGKSSLLQALIGEMLYQEDKVPKIRYCGSVAYVSQKAWIQNATVRDNIVFGYRFSEQRYKDAIRFSCLGPDLKILIKGDQTMIGEKGVNLSGGQKARISLARAIYSDADIILLDDPISAVDAYVGNFIMTQCLNGYMKTKTRLLVTHALNNCKFVDYIYLMEDGKIIEQGKFEEIKNSENFKKIYEKFYKDQAEEEENIEDELERAPQLLKRQTSEQKELEHEKKQDEVDELMIEEDRERGTISWTIYKEYFKSNGGLPFYLQLIGIQLCWMACYIGNSLVIAFWAGESTDNPDIDGFKFLQFYFYFSIGQGVFAFLRPLVLVIKSVVSANQIHTKMINCLIYAQQCAFFERVPLGRLLNRFTKDLNSLDAEIYWGISWLSIVLSLLIANTFIYIYSSTPYIVIPLVLYMGLCWIIKELFLKASRELQRLESITKSPILSYFSESINGSIVIRVFKKQLSIIDKHCENVDINRKVFIALQGTTAWFIMMLGISSLFLNALAICYCVFISDKNAAFTGLLLTYASSIDANITECIQAFSLFELGLVSFERCFSYTKIEPEKAYKALVDAHQKNEEHQEAYIENWPKEGEIQYSNYSLQYREGLKPALKNLTFKIEAMDKIGIVGRTGAGKSTITLSLLRILEAMEGRISIDGVDISTLSLKQLRESITMIMQDATIFDGTIRDNIDPLQQRSDQEILDIAQKCCLGEFIEKKEGLDGQISEGGENMSAGEKQLLCIARAVLKRSKIVLIDEATANIDVETEHKIQDTIIKVFKDCTVITIAHRINTILHCDKILVVDQGQMVEYGQTNELLQSKDSIFYGIYQEALKNQKK